MNKPLNIVDALKGNTPAVKQKPYQFTCWQCGRDNGVSNSWFSVRCVGFGCDAVIEAEENPDYIAPVSRMTLQRADNDTCGND